MKVIPFILFYCTPLSILSFCSSFSSFISFFFLRLFFFPSTLFLPSFSLFFPALPSFSSSPFTFALFFPSFTGTFIVISAFFLHVLVAVVIFHYRFDLPQAAARQAPSPETISALPDLCKDASGEKPLLEKSTDDPVLSFEGCKLPDVRSSGSSSSAASSKDDPIATSCLKELKHSLALLSCRKVWSNNEFLVFFANEFVFGLTVVLIENLLFDHLLAVGFGQWKAATCQALFSGCAAIGHICWGVIADHCSVMSVYCFAQLGTAFFIILAAMLNNFALAAVAIALAGFFKGANETLYCLVIIETLSVDYFYTGLVLLLTAGAVGEMVGTPMGGE